MPHTILLVDDSLVTREVLRLGLEAEGYVVHQAEDGIDAIGALGERPEIELVVLDIHMPNMDGMELLRQVTVSGTHPDVMFVAVTSDANPENIQTAVAAGAKAWMIKPVSVAALCEVVAKCFAPVEASQGLEEPEADAVEPTPEPVPV